MKYMNWKHCAGGMLALTLLVSIRITQSDTKLNFNQSVVPASTELQEPRRTFTGHAITADVEFSYNSPKENVAQASYAEPMCMAGFSTMNESERSELIATTLTDRFLETSTITFLKYVLQHKIFDETTRNNAANVLLFQGQIDREIPLLLLAMLEDGTESSQWRDYVVQHLAVSVGSYSRPNTIIEKLTNLAAGAGKGNDGIGATALLQIHRLHQEGVCDFPSYLVDLTREWVVDATLDQRVRMSCLSIIGERQDKPSRGLVRALLTDSDHAIRRQAIAVLGMIGDVSDVEILKLKCDNDDKIIARIANSALKNLQLNMSQELSSSLYLPLGTF